MELNQGENKLHVLWNKWLEAKDVAPAPESGFFVDLDDNVLVLKDYIEKIKIRMTGHCMHTVVIEMKKC